MIELQHDHLQFSFPDVHESARLVIDFKRTLRNRDLPAKALHADISVGDGSDDVEAGGVECFLLCRHPFLFALLGALPCQRVDYPAAGKALGYIGIVVRNPFALGDRLLGDRIHADDNGLLVAVAGQGTRRDGVDLARRLGTGLCLEVNSCFAERDLTTTIAGAADVLAHVQLNDFVIGSLSTPDRAVPGDGDIPLERIVGAILGTGYTGAFEIEMVGPRIEDEGYASAIERAVTYLDRMFATLDQSNA